MDFISEVDRIAYSPKNEEELGYYAQVSRGKGYADDRFVHSDIDIYQPDPIKTLRFCVKAGHLSILEFADITYRIQCPIFVARQLMRYRHASYIERSLRYCLPETKEWAQLIECPEDADTAYSDIIHHEEYSRTVYDDLVSNGARKEWARAVLPLSTETVFLMKVNLRELLHIFDERLTIHCQKETCDVVEQMYKITKGLFPIVIEEYEKKKSNC